MSILSLQQVSLILGGRQLLNEVDWHINARDKIALVGRNGEGKSTLLSLLRQAIHPDKGKVQVQSGLLIADLPQDVPHTAGVAVYDMLTQGLGAAGQILSNYYRASHLGDSQMLERSYELMEHESLWDQIPRIETMASRLGVDIQGMMQDLSGGMRRRVLLAAALIESPDLLLLDEPTNHLDLPTIEWLEGYLKNFSKALVFVTHDRTFLQNTARQIVELDRGRIIVYDCDYDTYLERREARLLNEQTQHALFDKRLAEEEAWIRQGVKARRARNEGRVRALETMRAQRRKRQDRIGQVQSLQTDAQRSGQIVIDAQNVGLQFDEKLILNNFSLLLTRGDKVGIIGPNGCGKTTLLRVLLGELAPDSGLVKLGTNLKIAYFDQLRSQLDLNKTVMYNVADGAEYVNINGQTKHVASWLSDFLFSTDRFNQPASTLSGGERNRLMLAKLLARDTNFLVMDEPTNDLDLETLEVLESMLVAYTGTLLLISHDRTFINRVVTSVLVYEKPGEFKEHVGDYDDYCRSHIPQKNGPVSKKPQLPKGEVTKHGSPGIEKPGVLPLGNESGKAVTVKGKLSYTEQKELARLPDQITQCEQKIQEMHAQFAAPEFYKQSEELIAKAKHELQMQEAKLAQMIARWEDLESL